MKLSHPGSEASSDPVPLPMSKDSSQHSTHPTQCCSAHRAERGRAWGSQGAHQLCVTLLSWHRRDNLHSRFTSPSLQASLVLPHSPFWAAAPPAPFHTPGHTTHHTPSEGWTQATPALQLGSAPS